ncbi:CST complex subunit TEN1 isoform 1 [Danio rerio]|uniref:CST complex subunit TEN1 n=1 Tax=Danio rerio TaxID=7955 RepID=X1WCR0_DANRE|nr:CST complex subunit TEN1 isoform 1 [Danio rerio]|eukprot:NP_001313295.1 CST complex subunit TEN1 isoform 1 [Danio rerio]
MLPPPAVYHFPSEISTLKDGASVRTFGRSVYCGFQSCCRLTSYKPDCSQAILKDQQSSAQCHVSVQTTLVEPFQPMLGAQYFVLGEIERTNGLSGVILRARSLACVEAIDLRLMQEAIVEQRSFFTSRSELNVQCNL